MTEEMEGQMSIFDLDGWSGKMYPEHSVQTKEKTSKPYSRKSSGLQNQTHLMCLCLKKESGPTQESCTMRWGNGVLPTKSLTPNTGERRSEEDAFLWSLTEGGVQASEVLFKQYSGTMPEPEIQSIAESVSGYFEQSDKKGQETARTVGNGTSGAISFQERAGKPGGGQRNPDSEREDGRIINAE